MGATLSTNRPPSLYEIKDLVLNLGGAGTVAGYAFLHFLAQPAKGYRQANQTAAKTGTNLTLHDANEGKSEANTQSAQLMEDDSTSNHALGDLEQKADLGNHDTANVQSRMQENQFIHRGDRQQIPGANGTQAHKNHDGGGRREVLPDKVSDKEIVGGHAVPDTQKKPATHQDIQYGEAVSAEDKMEPGEIKGSADQNLLSRWRTHIPSLRNGGYHYRSSPVGSGSADR